MNRGILHVFSFFAAMGYFVIAPTAFAAETAVLESKTLAVTVDTSFPRILQYQNKVVGETIEGQKTPTGVIELNGKETPCKIAFRKESPSQGTYRISFPREKIELAIHVLVGDDCVELRMDEVGERGTEKLKTLAFPGSSLLTIRSTQPDAALAATFCTCMNDHYQGDFRERIGTLDSMTPMSDTGNYFFASAGKLAMGIAGNHPVDVQRTAWKIVEQNGEKICTAWNPGWLYREIDSETVVLPSTKVFLTGDVNGDGKADWQDAAIVYRKNMPKPFGSEYVRTTVGENIAMNFASGAQQPFLRILDAVKKCYLATDGLGQQVIIKGFSSEGHDSANTDYGGHYNERAGGLKDFTVLLDRAHQYNARIGIHINASEVYPEARRYDPKILQRTKDGNPVVGWTWLDQAHMIDKKKDTVSGALFSALDQMRKELPKLDFVYVDTYWEHGWPAWKLAEKLKSLNLPFYTEGDMPIDPWTAWSHWRGKGSTVMRFLWFSDRDIFNNDPLLRNGRTDADGFLGWQNQHNFKNFLLATFTRNLPSKFLKHYELLRWEPGKEAVFSNGVKVVKEGDVVHCTKDGRLVMTWTGGGSNSRLFVPWDPKSEAKIYVWDEVETSPTWQLPPSWKNVGEAFLYKLSAQGRVEETRVPVVEGRVTLKIEKSTPYVLYPQKAPVQQPLVWGEGSPVKDPGFDSYGFSSWKQGPAGTSTEPLRIESDKLGNARLVISGNEGAVGEVSQEISLESGKTYAASVWVQVKGKRKAMIEVLPLGVKSAVACSNFVTQTKVRHSAPNDPRTGSNYQRLKVVFDMPPGSSKALLTLKAEKGDAESMVEFDDVRVVETKRSVASDGVKHWFFEDFENVDQGYGPFTCCPDEFTHLSEANPPYTKDTINGEFSLKSRGKGRILRTLPATIRFKPLTKYRLSCETLTDPSGRGKMIVESDGKVVFKQPIVAGRSRVTGEFATGADEESFLSIFKDGGEMLVLDDLVIDELGPASGPTVIESAANIEKLDRSVLLEEDFKKPLSADWTVQVSKRPDTKVEVAKGVLSIHAGANVSAVAERKLPRGVTAVECRLSGGDAGQTWGPGMSLVWDDGKAIRLNLRSPDGRFGIDATGVAQRFDGSLVSDGPVTLRIRFEKNKIFLEARNADDVKWQSLGNFPREQFPGEPKQVRLGKMHGVEGLDDHTDPGSDGQTSFEIFRVYGK